MKLYSGERLKRLTKPFPASSQSKHRILSLTKYAPSNWRGRVRRVRKRKELRQRDSLNSERLATHMKVYRTVCGDNSEVINAGVITAAKEYGAIYKYCDGVDRPDGGCHYVIESPGEISRGRRSTHLEDGKCFKVRKYRHGLIAVPCE